MARRIELAVLLVALACGAAAAKSKEAKKMKRHTVEGITFQAPESGVEVKEVGVRAHEVALMDPAKPGEKGAWITLYRMSKEELGQVPEAARLSTFKTTYLGTAKPAEKQVTREIMKRKVSGDWQQAKIPKALTLEAFQVPLPDGGALFVGMRRAASFSEADAGAFFDAVAASLQAG